MPKRTKSSSVKVMPVKSTVSETFKICICIYLYIKFKRVGWLVLPPSFIRTQDSLFYLTVTSCSIIIVRFSVIIRCLLDIKIYSGF